MGKRIVYVPGCGVKLILIGYQLVDKKHNVWKCRQCGHLARFEADGPFENGWKVCPACLTPVYSEDGSDGKNPGTSAEENA